MSTTITAVSLGFSRSGSGRAGKVTLSVAGVGGGVAGGNRSVHQAVSTVSGT